MGAEGEGQMNAETLSIVVALGATGAPPTEFRIFAKGEVKTRKGQFLFDEPGAKSVMAHAAEFGAEYPLDYGHAMLGGGMFGHADPAEGNKAAGWFRPEMRDGELWATAVTWTPTAEKKLREREYRYISPAFQTEDVALDANGKRGRRVMELINVALSNVPATKGLTPLVLDAKENLGALPRRRGDMPVIELGVIAATVGLAATATETDVLGRLAAQREAMGDLTKATGKGELKEALGVILGWQAGAARTEQLATELAALATASRKKDVEGKVDAKISALEVSPAEREMLVTMGMGDPAKLDGYLSVRNFKIAATDLPRTNAVDSSVVPRVTDKPRAEVLHALGMTAEQYEKTQEKMRKAGVMG